VYLAARYTTATNFLPSNERYRRQWWQLLRDLKVIIGVLPLHGTFSTILLVSERASLKKPYCGMLAVYICRVLI